ncbi:MAG: zeta toxin family protein [Chitinophagaceae bacterium]|nr:zeta toxin family protein [Chitinophagaceae bacterium]
MPDLYIITGANGSGKSTLGFTHLPKIIQDNYQIFDGDKLAMQKRLELYRTRKFSIKEAKHLADEWLYERFESSVKTSLAIKDDFVYEGHFPSSEHWRTITRFKRSGYKIHLIFFGLTNTELSALRVKERAIQGGHDVPPYEIERNYYGNLFQLNKRFENIDELKIVDTSAQTHKVLALLKNGEIGFAIHHGKLPGWFQKGLPKLFRKISSRDNKNPFGALESI